jgi:hypothetical protein
MNFNLLSSSLKTNADDKKVKNATKREIKAGLENKFKKLNKIAANGRLFPIEFAYTPKGLCNIAQSSIKIPSLNNNIKFAME